MAISITKQPKNRTGLIGSTVTFTVEAEGESLTYQWKLQTKTGTTWSNSGATGATTNEVTFNIQSHQDGFKYRCEITDVNGNVVTTDVATLTIIGAMPDRGLIDHDTLTDIADAIRDKLSSEDTMLPSEMAALIASIKTGGKYASGSKKLSGTGSQTFSFTHGLGEVPNLIILRMMNYDNSVITSILFPDNTKYHAIISNGSVGYYSFTPTVTETTASFKATTNQYSGTCYWFAGVL